MKKCFYPIFLLMLVSCDKRMDYDYFIINQCNEEIIVYVEVGRNNNSKSIVILPNENELIYHGVGINELQDRLIEHFFNKITINKEGKTSKLNYVDKNLWKFEPTSKDHANSYLTVNPEDFE